MKEHWNTAKIIKARAAKKQQPKKEKMPEIPSNDFLSQAAKRAVDLCDGNSREAMYNDITGWLELPELDYVLARWHLFFPE